MEFQLSGLASGFDWLTMVDRITEINRIPQNRLVAEQSILSSQLSSLDDLKSRLEDLEDASEVLNSGSVFFGRSASVSDSDAGILTASVKAETQIGTYSFVISQLASQTRRNGSSDVAAPISSTSDVSGVTLSAMNIATPVTAGKFSVNGAQVTVATSDSLQDVFDAISTATSGVVTASYDPAQDRVVLSSASEIILGSPNDTSNFLSAMQLFSNGTGSVSSLSSLGTVNINTSLANAGLSASITNVDGSGNGTFTINGESIAFNINNDSVRDIIERVAASDAAVTLNYDSATDSFALISKETGSLGVSVSETAGGLLEALGLNSTSSLALGKDAQFTVDGGGTLTSNSNILDEDVHGIVGLSVTAAKAGSETVTVSGDASDTRSKIDDFITKYNAVQSFISDNTEITVENDEDVTTSILTENREVREMARDLRQLAFAQVSGLQGTVKRLQDIGIDFKDSSDELEVVDSDALDSALANEADDVATLFTDSSEGLANTFNSFIEKYIGTDGTLETQTDNLNNRSDRIDDQIDTLERRIEADRQALIDSFVRMEGAQARLQQQLGILTRSLSFLS